MKIHNLSPYFQSSTLIVIATILLIAFISGSFAMMLSIGGDAPVTSEAVPIIAFGLFFLYLIEGAIGLGIGSICGKRLHGFVLSAILGPIGWIIIAVMCYKATLPKRICPYCCSRIHSQASVCRYCQRELQPASIDTP